MRGNVALRGVLMSAVGLLCTNYHNHHHHISFLSDQVQYVPSLTQHTRARSLRLSCTHLHAYSAVNHAPSVDHELLVEYFHNSQQVLDEQSAASLSSSSPLASSPSLASRIPHGYFINFLRHFGPHVFSIWKSVLLRQRILFYAPPPVRATCAHVYCANMLGHTRVRHFRWDANPLFYVNINDMKTLHEQETFIAATTEAIFQKKFHIYDVYVAKYKFHMPTKEAELTLQVTDGDRSRYRYLLEIVSTYLDTYKAEQHLIKYALTHTHTRAHTHTHTRMRTHALPRTRAMVRAYVGTDPRVCVGRAQVLSGAQQQAVRRPAAGARGGRAGAGLGPARTIRPPRERSHLLLGAGRHAQPQLPRGAAQELLRLLLMLISLSLLSLLSLSLFSTLTSALVTISSLLFRVFSPAADSLSMPFCCTAIRSRAHSPARPLLVP
jgi:hypothetical protein